MSEVFESMSSNRMTALIGRAYRRVMIAAPAIHEVVGEALLNFQQRAGKVIIEVALDCDPDIMRLGYGSISTINKLQEEGVFLRQSTGLRIGAFSVDESGWAFAPAAL
jgi:hypothetical protein